MTTTAIASTEAVEAVLTHVNFILPIFRPTAQVRQIGFVKKHVATLDIEITGLGDVPFTLIELKGGIDSYDEERTPEHWTALREQTERLAGQIQMYVDDLANAQPAEVVEDEDEPEAEVEELQPALPVEPSRKRSREGRPRPQRS